MKQIFILGEAWGANEAQRKHALVGASGIQQLQMMDEAGLLELTSEDNAFIKRFWETRDPVHVEMVWRLHPEFFTTNVFNLQPPANKLEALCVGKMEAKELCVEFLSDWPALTKGKFCRRWFGDYDLQAELLRLQEELIEVDPDLIIALGNAACWAILGRTAISKIRGTTTTSTRLVEGIKVLPTYHPAAVLRQWELRPTTIADLMKAQRESASANVTRPHREIWIEPDIADIEEFRKRYIHRTSRLSIDIETAGTQITMLGIAPRKDLAIVIPFVDNRRLGRSYWPTRELEAQAWEIIKEILENPEIPKTFQNGLYDIAFIWRTTGIKVYGAEHDTMLLHHALQPESLKGLGYLGSVYTDEGAWKHMREKIGTIKRDD